MSWIQNLCETYDACKDAVGIGEDQTTALLPLGHLLTGLDVIVYLQEDGTLYRAEKLSGKTKMLICIPCTDESEARAGTKAIDFPHPLFDQIKYLSTPNYLDNLKKWMDYLHDSPKYLLAYKVITAVYNYIVKGTLSDDLQFFQITVKDDMFIGFCVSLDDSLEDRLWMMPELWDALMPFNLPMNYKEKNERYLLYNWSC